ncbi:protein roadkill [Caerostris darwini]|uniref:Protein roadkill n=1 Tax=Caerostris darwini TaxID=1538125 RepID=A0AAV4UE75_9ARAC|nr:protein roadkill [Caerostris darwini]
MGVRHSSTVTENVLQTLKWEVENISKLSENQVICGHKLYFSRFCRGNFKLKIINDCLHIYLHNKSDTDLKTECSISYLTIQNEESVKLGHWILEVPQNKCVIVSEIENFTTEFMKTLPKDTLILQFELKTEASYKDLLPLLSGPIPGGYKWFDERKRLHEDLSLMHNDENTDVSLKIGDEIVHAHWSILCARSPYFKNMYRIQKKEDPKNSVVITDISAKAIREFVAFLYTGIFEDVLYENTNLDEVYDLYRAADKYEVLDLRKYCGYSLMARISVENAVQILNWADIHNDKEVKTAAMDFVSSNFVAITDTDGWKKLTDENPKLAGKVIAVCTKKLKNSK